MEAENNQIDFDEMTSEQKKDFIIKIFLKASNFTKTQLYIGRLLHMNVMFLLQWF